MGSVPAVGVPVWSISDFLSAPADRAGLTLPKKIGTLETRNDLHATVVRLQLPLFSKDIGAF
jgi:hypothetical protein